jgi:hypothetical protein
MNFTLKTEKFVYTICGIVGKFKKREPYETRYISLLDCCKKITYKSLNDIISIVEHWMNQS